MFYICCQSERDFPSSCRVQGSLLGPDTVRSELVANATLFIWTSVNAQEPVDAIKKCIKVARCALSIVLPLIV